MLKIQEFIFAHENWRELLSAAPYNLKISEDDGFVLFKYNQITSDFHEEICKEARGLILDTQDNFKVVRMAFRKFFNLGEPFAARLDWNSAVASEKIDGSIMSVWYARGKWHLSTNGVIDAFKAEISSASPYKTFGELFESVLPLSWFANYISNYFAHMCYTFELVSPYNRVVIDYPETKVYLLSVRNMNTLVEYSLDEVAEFAKRFNFAVPERYELNNEEDYCKFVTDMSEGHEGIVVCDANYNRVKIKTESYVKAHRLSNNNTMTLAIAIGLIRSNEQNEFLSYFPVYKDYFVEVQNKINAAIRKIDDINTETAAQKEKLNQLYSVKNAKKQFALSIKDNPLKNLYFLAWDDKLTHKWVESLTDACFIKNLRLEN